MDEEEQFFQEKQAKIPEGANPKDFSFSSSGDESPTRQGGGMVGMRFGFDPGALGDPEVAPEGDFEDDFEGEDEDFSTNVLGKSDQNTIGNGVIYTDFINITYDGEAKMRKFLNSKIEFLSKIGEGAFSSSFKILYKHPQHTEAQVDDNNLQNIQEIPENSDPLLNDKIDQIQENQPKEPIFETQAIKQYNKIVLEGQRKLDYETMEWTNNLQKLVSEVELWGELSPLPAVCSLYEVFEMEGEHKVFLRMQLGDLGLLADFDDQTRTYELNEDLVKMFEERKIGLVQGLREVFGQLIDGLRSIHERQVYHRDIKIENIVVLKNDKIGKGFEVKYIDFNSASKFRPDKPLLFDTEGTLQYCPPEEIFCVETGFDGFKSDIWSLGVCFYALVFGRLPFDLGEGAQKFGYEMELNMKISKEEIDWSGAGAGWELGIDLIKGMMCRDVAKRFDFGQIQNHDFFNA